MQMSMYAYDNGKARVTPPHAIRHAVIVPVSCVAGRMFSMQLRRVPMFGDAQTHAHALNGLQIQFLRPLVGSHIWEPNCDRFGMCFIHRQSVRNRKSSGWPKERSVRQEQELLAEFELLSKFVDHLLYSDTSCAGQAEAVLFCGEIWTGKKQLSSTSRIPGKSTRSICLRNQDALIFPGQISDPEEERQRKNKKAKQEKEEKDRKRSTKKKHKQNCRCNLQMLHV